MSATRFGKAIGLVALPYAMVAQSPSFTSTHFDFGRISHANHHAIVEAHDARPLAQAVVALRQEYGWLVDYEDPIYSANELTDVMSPEWRAAHPLSKRLLRPAGEGFSAEYQEDLASGMNSDSDRGTAINAVVDAFARSGNPGRFRVIQTGPNRLDVVGITSSQVPVLDEKVSITFDKKPAFLAISEVLTLVQSSTGHRMDMGNSPITPLMHCPVTRSISGESARATIVDILAICHLPLVWQLLFDANLDMYLLNLDGAVIVTKDIYGQRKFSPAPRASR